MPNAPLSAPTPLFLYEAPLEAPRCAVSPEPQPMRLRGYRLVFVGSASATGGSTASLVGIRGDGTVPGVVYEVDDACLADLDEQQLSRGYERTQIHIEEIAPGRGGPTTPATAYVVAPASGATASAPDEPYVTAMRAAWEAHGLDTGALDHALDHP